ncbi:MAG: methyltransferase domain-containing protein [bacterium]
MHESVKQYYGKELQTSADLKTDACCTTGDTPDWLKSILADIHPEVSSKYYGCGLVVPELLEGLRVLDLGSGSGRDCFALARLVGEQGSVVGVDMTDEQLQVANNHVDYHAQQYGYQCSNVSFHKGYIERLDELGFEPGSFDLIVSNCVINLSPDKAAVLEQAYNLLAEGGEMYFSDVYADRRLPEEVINDPVLYGECLGGALYWNDFLTLARDAGFGDPRLVEDRPLAVDSPALQQKLGNARFYSATYRLFKLPALESACEDYGQAVIYQGTIPHHPHQFELDNHHLVETGKVFPVCGNTWRMLHDTRFRPHFEFIGNFDHHYGIFPDCGSSMPFSGEDEASESGSSGSCC